LIGKILELQRLHQNQSYWRASAKGMIGHGQLPYSTSKLVYKALQYTAAHHISLLLKLLSCIGLGYYCQILWQPDKHQTDRFTPQPDNSLSDRKTVATQEHLVLCSQLVASSTLDKVQSSIAIALRCSTASTNRNPSQLLILAPNQNVTVLDAAGVSLRESHAKQKLTESIGLSESYTTSSDSGVQSASYLVINESLFIGTCHRETAAQRNAGGGYTVGNVMHESVTRRCQEVVMPGVGNTTQYVEDMSNFPITMSNFERPFQRFWRALCQRHASAWRF
jgi:hypothetical protein